MNAIQRWAWLLLLIPASVLAGEDLVTSAVTRGGKVVPYILNHDAAAPSYVVILFPGGNGIVNPRMEDGKLIYLAQGNFLLRSRQFLVDEEFASVTTDSTRDEERIQAIVDDLHARYPAAKIYLMGTSRGTYDTMALAEYLSDKIAGEIHTSSMSNIASFDARNYRNRHLVVHHRYDSCNVTPYVAAEASHERYGNDFIAMEGGVSVGDACKALAYHGYNGIERETIEAIKQWIKNGE